MLQLVELAIDKATWRRIERTPHDDTRLDPYRGGSLKEGLEITVVGSHEDPNVADGACMGPVIAPISLMRLTPELARKALRLARAALATPKE